MVELLTFVITENELILTRIYRQGVFLRIICVYTNQNNPVQERYGTNDKSSERISKTHGV